MRQGKTDWKVLAIGGMAVVVVVLLAVLLGSGREKPVPPPPDMPPPPDIIRARKTEGHTYRTSVVGQVTGRAYKKDWGFGSASHFLYRWELVYDSAVLKNDGTTMEEDRRFLVAQTQEIVAPRRFDIGTGWILGLELAGYWVGLPGAGAWVKGLEVGANKWLSGQPDVEELKLRRKPLSIEGKRVRLVVDDVAKDSTPRVIGDLTPEDKQLLEGASLLLDARTLPKEDMQQGETWMVDAAEFATFLDPELEGKVAGTLALTRLPDTEASGDKTAPLAMDLFATLRDRYDGDVIQGRFSASGEGLFNKTQGVLESAKLVGMAEYSQVSEDHFLFEARQEYTPNLAVEYRCYDLSDPDVAKIAGKTVSMDQFLQRAPKEVRELAPDVLR